MGEMVKVTELTKGDRFVFEPEDAESYEYRGHYGKSQVLVRRDDGYVIPMSEAVGVYRKDVE